MVRFFMTKKVLETTEVSLGHAEKKLHCFHEECIHYTMKTESGIQFHSEIKSSRPLRAAHDHKRFLITDKHTETDRIKSGKYLPIFVASADR